MNEKVSILFAGDTFPVSDNFDLFCDGKTEELFGDRLCRMFADADYSVCNLEGCFTDNGEPVEKVGPSVKAPVKAALGIKKLGFRAATLANTHTLDYGSKGHDEMRAALDNYGIEYFGTGDSKDSIKTHITVTIKGITVTFYTVTELFAFNKPGKNTPGANGYDEYAVCKELAELKKNCDRLVVLYHGGAEMTCYSSGMIRKRFHRMADNGADIILAQHTHAIAFEEYYNGAYLLYGQGNFCFNLSPRVSEYTATGILLEAVFGADGFEIKKHLVRRTKSGCEYAQAQDFAAFDERTRLHDRVAAGDESAEAELERRFSEYSTGFWMPRLLKVFRGINSSDDRALENLPPAEITKHLLTKYTKQQLLAIQMLIDNDEFNEIASRFISEAIKNKE